MYVFVPLAQTTGVAVLAAFLGILRLVFTGV
jgi:hypothetical protein